MRQLQRSPAPAFWTRERVKRWTKNWLNQGCQSNKWRWPQYDRRGIHEYAREAMEGWHYQKCAFCEAPLFSGREIEHFRSKTKHGLAAFVWRNLFIICRDCNQAKGDKDHQGCVKPDCHDPEDFLWVNPFLQKVEPKPNISYEAHQRALKTIRLYKLDRLELKKLYNEYLKLAGVIEGSERSHERWTPAQQAQKRADLRMLADRRKPFSLMVKSYLDNGH